MRSFIAASVAALALGATAKPTTMHPRSTQCMTYEQAHKVAENYVDLVGAHFSAELAKSAMASDFTDYCDSVIELINASPAGCAAPIPLGSATFTSRSGFIKLQGAQPPIKIRLLDVWNACNAVAVRWRSPKVGAVNPEEEVTGVLVIETTPNPDKSSDEPFLIETVFSEFNSGAWLYDIGNYTTSCASSTSASSTGTAKRSLHVRPGYARLF